MLAVMHDPPQGFTHEYNPDIWNVGHVFVWSDVFAETHGVGWLQTGRMVDVKPLDNLQEAHKRKHGKYLNDNEVILFVEDF